MAKAFPAFPQDMSLPLHHSQRFFASYVLGGVAWLLHVPAEDVFFPFVVLAILGIVLAFHKILDRLGLEPEKRVILLSFLILNTYMFRYYLAIPWMISDVGFQLGLAVLLLGLLSESSGLTLAGLLTSALSKQTALLLIPGVMGWIWWEWRTVPPKVKVVQCVGAAVSGTAVYQGTTWLVRGFSGPSLLTRHVTGLVTWMATAFSPTEAMVFVARGLIGFAFPGALLLSLWGTRRLPAGWHRNRRLRCCLVLAGSICLQPILAGPVNTGHSISRLAMLAYAPVLVGLGSILAETSLPSLFQRRLAFLSAFSVAISSFHHFYSFLGISDVSRAGRFAAVYVAAAGLLFVGSLVLQHAENSERA